MLCASAHRSLALIESPLLFLSARKIRFHSLNLKLFHIGRSRVGRPPMRDGGGDGIIQMATALYPKECVSYAKHS